MHRPVRRPPSRPALVRTGRAVLALSLFLPAAAAAEAGTPYVVADVSTGRVLMQEEATMPWYPASVTKLMTTYVALRHLRDGSIGWETPIPYSMRAARSAPSKIGLKPGQEVTLENALKMMLVKSANDMAVVIAEGVGGTVEDFATLMNAEAARLGMRESHFVNPNGLHAPGQQTSARDLALLARALLNEFPDHADLFQIPAVQLGDRVMKNTNGLIGRYPGVEGMKTGFICPSGFNLVAVASRNGQRLVAVVLGQPTAADRTIKAAQLLDKGFGSTGGLFGLGSGSLDTLPRSPVSVAPNMREDVCVRRKGPPASEEELDTQTTAFATPESDGPRLFGAPIVASMAPGSSVRGTHGPRSLSERAPLEPVAVFVGRSPGSANAPQAANARPIPVKPDAPATATAGFTPAGDDAVQPAPAAARAPLVLPPVSGAAKGIGTGARPSSAPRLGAVGGAAAAKPATAAKAAVKPAPKAAAKPAAVKPAAKAPVKAAAKPKPASKPKAVPAPKVTATSPAGTKAN